MPTTAPADKPSVIKLTSFSIVQRSTMEKGKDVPPHILCGATKPTKAKNAYELEIASVPLMYEQEAPPTSVGILALYGFKDAIEEIQKRRQEAREANAEFKFAEIECEVGEIELGLVDRAKLRGLRFANVKRMNAQLQSEILDKFAEYVEDEGGDVPGYMSRVQQIAMRPDLFGRLLEEDKDFKRIEVLVIPVYGSKTYPTKVRQLAIIRPKAKIVGFSQNSTKDEDHLVLPKGYAAPKL